MIPDVTLCCEVQFQELTEVLAFFKAVKALAADTIDGHVTFKKLTFKDEVKTLFPGHRPCCLASFHRPDNSGFRWLPDGMLPYVLFSKKTTRSLR